MHNVGLFNHTHQHTHARTQDAPYVTQLTSVFQTGFMILAKNLKLTLCIKFKNANS